MSNVFISYSRRDGDFVARLGEHLKRSGVDVWFDQTDIRAGERWDRAVEKALQQCELLLVVLSPDSASSDAVMDEVTHALDGGVRVIPLLARACRVPLRLARLQYIDFVASYDRGFVRLLDEITASKRGEEPAGEGRQGGAREPSWAPSSSPRGDGAMPSDPAPQIRRASGSVPRWTPVAVGAVVAACGVMMVVRIGDASHAPPTADSDLVVSADVGGPLAVPPIGQPPAPGRVGVPEGTAPVRSARGMAVEAGTPLPPESAGSGAMPIVIANSDEVSGSSAATGTSIDVLSALLDRPEGESAAWVAAEGVRASQVVHMIARTWPEDAQQAQATSARRRLVTDMNARIRDGSRLVDVLADRGDLVQFMASSQYGQGADFQVPLRLRMAERAPDSVRKPTTREDCERLAEVVDVVGRAPVPDAYPWIRASCESCKSITGAEIGKCGEIK